MKVEILFIVDFEDNDLLVLPESPSKLLKKLLKKAKMLCSENCKEPH